MGMGNIKKEKNNTLLIALIVIVAIAITGLFVMEHFKNKEVSEEPEEVETMYGDESLCIDPEVDKALADYRMVEIVGIDNGGRSDIIFVAAINKKDNSAKLFTVYRDTLMKITSEDKTYSWGGHDYQYYKCNRSFQKEGRYGSMKMLNSHLDLNIREFLGLNWDAVEMLVNELGGIEVEVIEGVIPTMNDRLEPENRMQKSGKQTLNGRQAVEYLRVRYDSNAGVRSHRNEDVLLQIFDRVKAMDTKDALELYDKLSDQFVSNMSRTTITDTIATLGQVNVETQEGFPYDYEILWDKWDAFYYWVAMDDLKSNVIKLHKNVFGQADYVPSSAMEKLNDELNTYRETLH